MFAVVAVLPLRESFTSKMEPGSKTVELKGEMVDGATGKTFDCREVYTIVDANTRKMEMYCEKRGEEFKSMEIVMKRK